MVGHPAGNLNPEGSNVYEAKSGALEGTKLATGQFPRFLESRYHKSCEDTGISVRCKGYTLDIVFRIPRINYRLSLPRRKADESILIHQIVVSASKTWKDGAGGPDSRTNFRVFGVAVIAVMVGQPADASRCSDKP